MTKVIRIPPIKGCYGERFIVNSKEEDVYNFFKAICLWVDKSDLQDDFSTTTVFEMPVGASVKENPLVMNALNKWQVTFVDFEEEILKRK